MHRQLARTCIAAVVALAFVPLTGGRVEAQSVDTKQAEIRRLAEQQEAQIREAERLNQLLVRQKDELLVIDRDLLRINTQLVAQNASISKLGTDLSQSVIRAYVNGAGRESVGLLAGGLDGASDEVVRSAYLSVVNGNTTDLINAFRSNAADTQTLLRAAASQQQRRQRTVGDIEDQAAALLVAQKRLAADQARVAVELREAVTAEAARVALEQERKRLDEARRQADALRQQTAARQAEEAARRATEARRRTAATTAPAAPTPRGTPTSTARPRSTTPVDIPDYPAPSGAAAIAIAEAKRQLGKPYVFGADGPDTFDCSGLTQWAWAKAGVSMAHYTGSQAAAFPRVPLNALAPGDLVFFNINLGHMGMYLGGGRYIHAPQTGDVVKISSLDPGRVVVAVRPG